MISLNKEDYNLSNHKVVQCDVITQCDITTQCNNVAQHNTVANPKVVQYNNVSSHITVKYNTDYKQSVITMFKDKILDEMVTAINSNLNDIDFINKYCILIQEYFKRYDIKYDIIITTNYNQYIHKADNVLFLTRSCTYTYNGIEIKINSMSCSEYDGEVFRSLINFAYKNRTKLNDIGTIKSIINNNHNNEVSYLVIENNTDKVLYKYGKMTTSMKTQTIDDYTIQYSGVHYLNLKMINPIDLRELDKNVDRKLADNRIKMDRMSKTPIGKIKLSYAKSGLMYQFFKRQSIWVLLSVFIIMSIVIAVQIQMESIVGVLSTLIMGIGLLIGYDKVYDYLDDCNPELLDIVRDRKYIYFKEINKLYEF